MSPASALPPVIDLSDPADKRSLERFGQCAGCGLMLCSEDADGAVAYVNDALLSCLGYSRSAFLRQYPHPFDAVHPEDQARVRTAVGEALAKSDRYELICRALHKNGRAVWTHESGRRVLDAGGKRFLFRLVTDISSDLEARQELERQARTDALTGALNRAAFEEQTGRLLRELPGPNRCHAFIMIDLDHFAQINEALGHAAGDRLLSNASQSLDGLIRAGDLLARLGGDEFMLCLRDIPTGDVIQTRLSQICSLMRKRLSGGVTLSCSIGVSFFPQDGKRFDALHRCADAALYEAKKAGGNGFVLYRPELAGGGVSPRTPIDGGMQP